MNATTTETGNGEAVATSVGLAGGGASDGPTSYKITQESIDAHLTNAQSTWAEDAFSRAQRDEVGWARRHQREIIEARWDEYREKPKFFRTAAEVMATWPDEPANKESAA